MHYNHKLNDRNGGIKCPSCITAQYDNKKVWQKYSHKETWPQFITDLVTVTKVYKFMFKLMIYFLICVNLNLHSSKWTFCFKKYKRRTFFGNIWKTGLKCWKINLEYEWMMWLSSSARIKKKKENKFQTLLWWQFYEVRILYIKRFLIYGGMKQT